ncbi:phenylacetate-coenzyme A ligase PaaK-like adenylate-forming protein [Flavobacterium gossypii]|uniref:Phenylacetate-coenzyme A ligase PaaK-like adenylate-forming protein n=1 Tax=Flavobacterium gossypii TaxID=1646119 RepID=A0ABR6DPN7_9FLAO|nr:MULTISPECIES: acyl transferase [Flavobacterium]MBA9073653.1 phenylacetate-coenzyme A ligase PaaK-like adenylate-forming protein [Flavobacterium gossypii]WDO14094.1 acyl transferase [Flavobacterium sp. WW92]
MIPASDIFSISNNKQFEKIALKVFRFQYENNSVYREFCQFLNVEKQQVKSIEQIPFLPIQFFKSHEVLSSQEKIQETFTSSGTTGMTTSRHLVTDISLYEESYRKGFSQFYGNIENYAVLALLPSYLDREGSSLIYMVDDLIKLSNHPESGFYLNNYDELIQKLLELDAAGENIILIGVTYALLDLIEKQNFQLKNTIIMETGGMKGKRKEMIREELHELLCKGFGVEAIHSEYGMTELLSQAYSLGNGVFECPNWMQILIRDTEDALSYVGNGKTGGINVIDLANINSCSFIATQDLGKKQPNNSFEVLGRFDNSDIRGCNLMVL